MNWLLFHYLMNWLNMLPCHRKDSCCGVLGDLLQFLVVVAGRCGCEYRLRRQFIGGGVSMIVIADQIQLANRTWSYIVATEGLLYVLVIIDEGMNIVQRLSQREVVLISVINFLFVGGGETLPTEGIDKQRVLLVGITVERIFLAENIGILIVDNFLPIACVIEGFIIVVIECIIAVVRLLLSRAEAQDCPHLEYAGERHNQVRGLHFDGFSYSKFLRYRRLTPRLD